jgi:hypothetical protein
MGSREAGRKRGSRAQCDDNVVVAVVGEEIGSVWCVVLLQITISYLNFFLSLSLYYKTKL